MSSVMEAAWRWLWGSSTITRLTLVDFSIQWSLWLVACLLKTEKFYDLAGSATYIILASLNYKWNNTGHPRQAVQTGCVNIWALRLGLFLFTRIVKAGKDRRFDKTRANPVRFFYAWTLQGVWVLVTILPSLLAVLSPRQRPVGTRDYIGWGIWAMGFLIEVVADYQKTVFKNNPANKDKFINTGLWALSRHPNYFGEILLWFGLYVSASSTFSGWEYLTILCPLMDYLLITQVSGIPMLESYGRKKWGLSPQYQAYIRNTPILIPFLG
ncbi:probable O-methyltransferase ustE [Homarus americanus]|uniref:probable O-methyltransferase ustE n=1 Tax=Homarus americanus TaxID=6706 RepID=UPI001C45EDCE|nr:probable O-methyltransferase ustE [Homarus americanus]